MSPLQVETGAHLAAGGDAVARLPDGRVLFVKGAAPSECCEVEIQQSNKRFLRGRLRRVVSPGPARVSPRCPHAAECGGCTLQHLAASEQSQSKDQALTDNLIRIAKLTPTALEGLERPDPWTGASYGYRNRSRMALASGRLGFRSEGSRRVVSIQSCPVLEPALSDRLPELAEALPRGVSAEIPLLARGETIELALPKALHGAASRLRALGWRIEGEAAPMLAEDGLGPLYLSASQFAQANRAGNAALIQEIEALIARFGPVSTALELYAGAGNFTRRLVASGIQTEALEQNPKATALMNKALGSAVRVNTRADTALIQRPPRPVDLVLVDPPRAGLPGALIPWLCEAVQGLFIYVSCDPGSFSRDAKRLTESGLRLVRARLFDLYPQTAHAELVACFLR